MKLSPFRSSSGLVQYRHLFCSLGRRNKKLRLCNGLIILFVMFISIYFEVMFVYFAFFAKEFPDRFSSFISFIGKMVHNLQLNTKYQKFVYFQRFDEFLIFPSISIFPVKSNHKFVHFQRQRFDEFFPFNCFRCYNSISYEHKHS